MRWDRLECRCRMCCMSGPQIVPFVSKFSFRLQLRVTKQAEVFGTDILTFQLTPITIDTIPAHIACIVRGTSLLQLSPVPLSNSNGPGNTASIVPVMRRYLGVQIFRSRLDPKTGFLHTLKYLTNVSDLIYID